MYQSDALGNLAIAVYRFGHWVFYGVRLPGLRQALWIAYLVLDVLFVRIAAGSHIPARCHIGAGLCLPHANGVVIHAGCRVGDRVTIFHQVTLGLRCEHDEFPTIGNGATIGAGAKILGRVTIGTDAHIGANAVVLCDVPEGRTAVGVPATIR